MQSISSTLDTAALLGFGLREGTTRKVWSKHASCDALMCHAISHEQPQNSIFIMPAEMTPQH